MSVVTFDTLNYAKKLEQNGFTENQAQALAELQNEIFGEALENQLATKSDINKLETNLLADINDVKSEIKLIKWMLALVVLVTVIPVLKSLFV